MSAPSDPEIEYSGLSHIGPVREDNQDAIRLPDEPAADGLGALWAVADGMGGYSHGKLASVIALERLFDSFYNDKNAPAARTLRRGVERANLGVYQAAQSMNAGRMGSTLTAIHILGEKLSLAHIGDSRAYLIRDGRGTCLTNDHTTVGDLVRMRVLSPDRVRTHTQRSVLTKGLGLSLFIQPDLIELNLQENDRLVLCSDGVWSVIQDDEFARLAAGASNAQSLSATLIDLALDRQTDDNASAIAIYIQRLAPSKVRKNPLSLSLYSILRNLL